MPLPCEGNEGCKKKGCCKQKEAKKTKDVFCKRCRDADTEKCCKACK